MNRAALEALPFRERRLIRRSRELIRDLDAKLDPAILPSLEYVLSGSARPLRRRGRLHVRTAPDPKAALAWSIGQKIMAARRRGDRTQQDLADHCGIARANIARLEAGRHAPKLETLGRLARALGLEVSDLLREPGRASETEDARWLESDMVAWSKSLTKEDRKT
jgi:DNA-binding XRE family transcriptional regulator